MKHTARLFTTDDIEFALAQTAREGWDTAAQVFRWCLKHDPHGCFVAESNGTRVGMITTTSYGGAAWIGNLIVPPEHRYQGIGTSMMKQAMTYLAERKTHTIRLEADPPGVKLYRRLGFVDEFESLRFELKPADSSAIGSAGDRTESRIKTIQATSVREVIQFDAEYFGDDRSRLLTFVLEDAVAKYAARTRDRFEGYAVVQLSAVGLRIGPWVATGREKAEDLLTAALRDFADTTLVVGVPGVNVGAIALLESHGFERTPPCLRMVFGRHAASGRPERVFGIANGAMG